MHISFGGQEHEMPAGAVIGLVGETSAFLRTASGARTVSLDGADLFTRLTVNFEPHRRAGETVLLTSNDLELLRREADEVWWIQDGRVACKAAPEEALRAYTADVASRVRASLPPASVNPALRRGDGRSELVDIALLDAAGKRTGGWLSGDEAVIRVDVKFHAAVEAPVVGIMIRTRIGMEVYGTNTELEGVQVGPCAPGETRRVEFRFACDLCPGTYTLTAASHDPDGVWHDWLEDAVAFTVTDTRYTAGVANLRARVTCL
jgi:lipopolysaccharide transport system ATP-binding protein